MNIRPTNQADILLEEGCSVVLAWHSRSGKAWMGRAGALGIKSESKDG